MSDQELPVFGIRGLNSPSKPFSILSISEGQYNASVQSYPESALTWLDDDDGEVITVGSGSELRQRLEDPVPVIAPKVRYFNQDTQSVEDRYVHLFDIARSKETALSVWREHEAFFSKTQSPRLLKSPIIASEETLTKENKSQVVSDGPSNAVDASKADILPVTNTEPAASIETHDIALKNAVPELVDCLGRQLGHLADFLQTTSETLKRAAEKTREADTSPIEDILQGMTNILGEVGAFGLDVFDRLNEPTVVQEVSTPETTICEPALEKTVDVTPPSSESSKPLSWADWPSYSPEPELPPRWTGLPQKDHEPSQDRIENGKPQTRFMEATTPAVKPGAPPAYWSLDIQEPLLRESHKRPKEASPVKVPMLKDLEQPEAQNRLSAYHHTASNSILDQDADTIDADFSARFPPLMSLRRAKTTGTLRDKSHDKAESRMSNRYSSARPSPRVFDEETQRRRAFAQSCFPGQEYSPAPAQTSMRPTPGPDPAAKVATLMTPRSDSKTSSTLADQVRPLPAFSTANFVPDHTPIKIRPDVGPDPKPMHDGGYRRLPGAWPETKSDLKPVSSNDSPNESSGAFFNRMMMKKANTALAKDDSKNKFPATQHSLRRHGSLASPMNRNRGHGDLRRTQTVTSNTNPAARLNGPFDPVYPAPLFVDATEEEQPLLSKPTAGPIRSIHRSLSERRMRSLYEPYKHTSNQRDFEPVWEDHLQPKHADSQTGVVIIDASNFEPGTTEQTVRDLLSDDCNIGTEPSTLISCRIVSTEPIVTAKLVIKNKAAGDRLIQKYNKLIVRKRQLHFEYSKSGIDAQINHIRGAISHTETSERRNLRPMQSVPAFFHSQPGRSQSLRDPRTSKPTFAEFANRMRPAVAPINTSMAAPKLVQPPAKQTSQNAGTTVANDVASNVASPDTTGPSKAKAKLKPTPVDLCTSALESMGFGKSDTSLHSRLKVYAVAANGVVEDAIDMIEQDQKATFGSQAVKKDDDTAEQPAWLAQVEADEAETSQRLEAEELEWAIKMSMMDN